VIVGMRPGARCAWYDKSHRVEDVIRRHGRHPQVPGRRRTHPSEKPPELAAWFIGLHSRPGELVLDPFMGTGSTLIAALEKGRRAIGIEVEEEYCRVAADRVEKWRDEHQGK